MSGKEKRKLTPVLCLDSRRNISSVSTCKGGGRGEQWKKRPVFAKGKKNCI